MGFFFCLVFFFSLPFLGNFFFPSVFLSENPLALWLFWIIPCLMVYFKKRGNTWKHSMPCGLHSLHRVHLLKFTFWGRWGNTQLSWMHTKHWSLLFLTVTVNDLHQVQGPWPSFFYTPDSHFSVTQNSWWPMPATWLSANICFLPSLPLCTKWQLVIFQYLFLVSNMGGEAVAAFNPNSRQNDLVDIFELFSLNQIFRLELRKLFQSQTLCITRNKYYLRRLLDPL